MKIIFTAYAFYPRIVLEEQPTTLGRAAMLANQAAKILAPAGYCHYAIYGDDDKLMDQREFHATIELKSI